MEVFRTDEQALEPYAPPEIVDYGDLVDVTAHDHRHSHPTDLPHHPLHPWERSFSS
jgi:hypothetical protein